MSFASKFLDKKYKYNQTIIKVYGYGDNKKIKVIKMNTLRTAGLEEDFFDKGIKEESKRGTVNKSKLETSVKRSKQKIFELAYCNPWDFFFTGTLDSKKYNREDLKKYQKDFTQWLRDYNKKHNIKIKYILIPELHQDGKNWHFHGFLYGLPKEHLKQFVLGDKMGKYLAEKVKEGAIIYNWLDYQNKFGFCDLEPIENTEAVSKYVTKYINKDLANSVTELNANLYYHSLGLEGAKVIKKGTMLADIVPDFENDYCAIQWIEYSDQNIAKLCNLFEE